MNEFLENLVCELRDIEDECDSVARETENWDNSMRDINQSLEQLGASIVSLREKVEQMEAPVLEHGTENERWFARKTISALPLVVLGPVAVKCDDVLQTDMLSKDTVEWALFENLRNAITAVQEYTTK
jgi:hypothetical protein